MLEEVKEEEKVGNKMEAVAKLLGVEMGEEFDIEGPSCNPHRLTSENLVDGDGDNAPVVLVKLLSGECKIVERPFRPEKNEYYWYIIAGGGVYQTSNTHLIVDYLNISNGNCFRTREEAKAHAEEWVRKCKEFFENESGG